MIPRPFHYKAKKCLKTQNKMIPSFFLVTVGLNLEFAPNLYHIVLIMVSWYMFTLNDIVLMDEGKNMNAKLE